MELRRVAPVVGLCALLAADAVLIAWAFRGTPTEDPGLAAAPRPLPSISTSASASPSSTRSAASLEPVPVERIVAAVGPTIAWVAQAGSCEKPGAVWVTDDEGDSWSRGDAPGRVLRVRPSSATEGFVTGGDDGCDLRLWNTGDAGRAWSESEGGPAEAWSRVPDDAKAVHTPDDAVRRPCGSSLRVLDLAALTAQRARVLCENGDVRTTTDRGASWPRSFTVEGALAIGAVEGGSGVVVRTTSACRGVVAVPVVGGKPDGDGVCVAGRASPGTVSVSGTGAGWWLVVGDRVHRAERAEGPWERTGAPLDG